MGDMFSLIILSRSYPTLVPNTEVYSVNFRQDIKAWPFKQNGRIVYLFILM